MLGNIAAGILAVFIVVSIVAWLHGLVNSDGRCDPGEDCENCPFPCKEHERKRK